ncbi:MAG UNVERIFIED_CONTAM: hypothetical protein LVR18_23395 [Planctomycetaceae bacterium]|jgi:hypothetical protein
MNISSGLRRSATETAALVSASAAFLIAAAAATWWLSGEQKQQSADIASVPLYDAVAPAPADVLTGSSCVNCHADISESHASSPHGRTLLRLHNTAQKNLLAGRSYTRPDTAVQFEYQLEDDRLLLKSSASAQCPRNYLAIWLWSPCTNPSVDVAGCRGPHGIARTHR